jgi:flagella basal body P-ring formation protein FlgA
MMMAAPILLALAATPGGCQQIRSDMIFARDVAVVVPAFAQIPGDFHLGFVPTSGAPRLLRGVDLERIAKNQGLELNGLPDVCFARQTFSPQPEQIREAMRTALNVPGAKLEVLAWSQHPAPAGELVFPRSGLQLPASSGTQSEILWRGYVRYSESQTFPFWAKVRITATMTRVVAATAIPAGKPIQRNQVRLESCEDFPLDETTARNVDEVIGYLPKSLLRAGIPVSRAQIERPPDVARGDLVEVQIYAGAAHLVLEGRAQSAGVTGSTILVRNPSSGKDFRAQVTGKDKATAGGASGGIVQ